MTTEISLSNVKKHNSRQSLWMVIHHDVYDVTSFVEEHPGGADTLLEFAGKDATQAFEDVGHSEDARELLKKFKIGTLPASEKTREIPVNCGVLKWVLLLLAGAIVVGLVVKKKMQ